MPWLCRDCLRSGEVDAALGPGGRCASCAGPRVVRHPELHELSLAHIDCDAFYATIEKRDRPELREKPVVVGGKTRGVVAAACSVARLSGVRSAMPMFKALKACPDAIVISPDMAKYATVVTDLADGSTRKILNWYRRSFAPLNGPARAFSASVVVNTPTT